MVSVRCQWRAVCSQCTDDAAGEVVAEDGLGASLKPTGMRLLAACALSLCCEEQQSLILYSASVYVFAPALESFIPGYARRLSIPVVSLRALDHSALLHSRTQARPKTNTTQPSRRDLEQRHLLASWTSNTRAARV
jgi:hypothetical protein